MLIDFKTRPVLFLLLTGLIFAVASASGRTARAQKSPPTAPPVANDPIFHIREKKSKIKIVEKFAKLIKLDKRITTVYGFDQEVVSVSKVDRSPNMIRVHAQAPGVTSMVLVDETNAMYTVEFFVTGDVRYLQGLLNRMFPHSSIEAIPIKDTVVLRGWVSQPEHITAIREIAEQFYANVLDQMKVGGAQQVLLKVRVMEVQRSKIRKFGFNFLYRNNNGGLTSTPGPLTPLTSFSAPFNSAPAIALAGLGDPTVAFAILRESNVFQGFLEALKEEKLLKILAEPELVTTNGRPANMLAGGEFPILVPQSLGTTTIQWREFGVRLEAVPVILGRGRVRLELQPEVSERDLTNSVQVGGLNVPGLTTRRVNTQVEMRFGETFMIAGLLSTRTTATTSKVPVLGDLPWIGAAFRRVSYEDAETELVILVTPELVSPMGNHQLPPGGIGLFTDSPTDRELFADGRIEITKYGERCVGCRPGPFSHSPISGPRLQGIAPLTSPDSGNPYDLPNRYSAPSRYDSPKGRGSRSLKLPPAPQSIPPQPRPTIQNLKPSETPTYIFPPRTGSHNERSVKQTSFGNPSRGSRMEKTRSFRYPKPGLIGPNAGSSRRPSTVTRSKISSFKQPPR